MPDGAVGARVLTLTQPWASLVALGHKRVETRSWATRYRGPLLIHAAKGYPREAAEFAAEERALGRLPARVPRGAIVALAYLREVRPAQEVALEVSGLERRLGDYSAGRWAWMLDRDRLISLREPVWCNGRLGLWRLSGQPLSDVEAALGGGASCLAPPPKT